MVDPERRREDANRLRPANLAVLRLLWWGPEGATLFGDSIVALDCSTGKRNGIPDCRSLHLDYDLAAQPVLADVRRNGWPAPAVAQVTKTGFVFLPDWRNGAPLFPVEERPVPRSSLPGKRRGQRNLSL